MNVKIVLDKLCQQKNMSTSDLAKAIGVTRQTMWERLYSNKTKSLNVTQLCELARTMGYKVMLVPCDTAKYEGFYEVTE